MHSTDSAGSSGRLHFAGRDGLIGFLADHHDEGTLFVIELERFSDYAIVLDPPELEQLVEELWQTFESFVGRRGQVLRIDTSQFALLWWTALNHGQVVLAATRILEELRHLRFCRNAALQISPRIGVASGRGGGEEGRQWILHAYLALARTDQEQPRYAIFEPRMQTEMLERWELRQALARAMERQEFSLHYQPRIDLADETCSGVEALLRWDDRRFGWIRPDRFIPLLEDSGAIIEVTRWALHRASRELSEWLREDAGRSCGFNVSTRALADPEFAPALEHALGLWTLDPRQLVLEVTETAAWERREATSRALTGLRELGIRVAIDDFGTGHATLDYLRELPADEIKIDRTFVAGMLTSDKDEFLVQLVVDLGLRLGLTVVAEGAEEVAQLRRLRDMGCHCAQGFAVAPGMPRDALLEWIADRPDLGLG